MTEAERRFRAIYERCYAPILAYALRRIGSDHAHDVVAEVFLAAWRHLDRVPEDPLPWLYRLTSNALANQRRAMGRRARLQQRARAVLAPGGPAAADHADRLGERDRVEAALQQLSPGDREALRLVAWEDLDIAGAAAAMGCSPATMKVRLHRARRRLARLLGDDSPPRARVEPLPDPGPVHTRTHSKEPSP
jgi:RNA polymerase sigma factor (sigma-70 family)